MRFQSTGSFNKLAPTFTADAGGPYSSIVGSAGPGTNVQVLGPPPTGFGWRIAAFSAAAPTTGYAFQDIAVCDGNLHAIASGYASVNGVVVNWSGSILLATAVFLHNLTNVNAGCTIFYRQEELAP